MSENSQLIKKEGQGYSKVYPLAYIQGIIDAESKEKLSDILIKYNHLYVPWQGSQNDTRAYVSKLIRRHGLWISYDMDGSLYTEWFKSSTSDALLDIKWLDSSNWERIPDLKYVEDASLRIPSEAILPDMLSPALQEFLSEHHTINNMPDDEDLEQHCNVLRFKDRDYNEYLASGKGYKILRKNWVKGRNILTQAMINDANTIYEIRYDFDLNGAEIQIKEGCVLNFVGGSLSNGTLNGSKFNIDANYKIFDNIKFKGAIIYCLKLDLDWFVSDSIDGIYDVVDIDSSKQINDAISSGVKTILFPGDKYYYLKKPIIVNGDVDFLSKNIERNYDSSSRETEGHLPCIYSNEIITLLIYKYQSDAHKTGVTIGKLNFNCRKPYETLDDVDTPIVKIETVGDSGIWGLNFNANILGKTFLVPLNESKKVYTPNYTGLKLVATKSFITYVKINGYIQFVFNGIVTEVNPGAWFTDVTINGDTRTVFGGKFNGGNPVRIFGSHQPIYAAREITNYKSYFSADWINLYGYIWDCGIVRDDGETQTVSYPIRINTNSTDGFYNSEVGSLLVDRGNISYVKENPFNFKINRFNNYLNYYYNPDLKWQIPLKYELNNVSIFNHNDIILYNDFNLFNTDSKSLNKLKSSPALDKTYNCYFLVINDNLANKDNVLSFECTINNTLLTHEEIKSPIIVSSSFMGTIKVEVLDEASAVLKTFNHNIGNYQQYYNNSYFLINYSRELNPENIFKIKLSINLQLGKLTNQMRCELPIILFGTNRYVPKPIIYKSIPNMPHLVAKGFTYYDQVKRKHITAYSNTEWFDENGNPADALTKGTTAQRPTGVQIGFTYKDTTLDKLIAWDGTKWVDSEGNNADIKYQGVFSEKPLASDGIQNGFAYFCTDKQTAEGQVNGIMIYHKGSDVWVDALGRVVS